MTDFAQARKNMVDCQIHTSGVVHPGLLTAFETTPRESFVPETRQGVAYYDETLTFENGRTLLAPLTLSKMLQEADPTEDDIVLDIGGTTGYGAAILSSNVSTIIALENNADFLKTAERAWAEQDACNIIACNGPLNEGQSDKGPYTLIVMHGAVPAIPENIVAQLAPNGRLLTIIKKPNQPIGQATLVQSLGENKFSSYTLFECSADYLDGFAPQPAFSF